ncbi:MAG: hypothetical protein B7C24_14285 [Bacteroidetes bacterium 4572_77]|nr:MAG: hypothetical protein B7C24_14285 [Bacteroidetes bacterium 4572_77]
MRLQPISLKQQIKNFAFNQERPFPISKVADETGIKENTVRKYLRILEDSGFIARVEGRNKIYYILNRRNKAGPYNNEKAAKVYVACNMNSAREIAKITGIKIRTVRMYLDMLFAAGSIQIINLIGKNEKLFNKVNYNGVYNYSKAIEIRREKIKNNIGVRYDYMRKMC